jgi:coenzyme F420-reducing hydrogenase beta subunit
VLSRKNVVYCLGLVCGHLKSRYFADYLAWQKGAELGTVATFDFRRKLMDRRASDYGFAYSQINYGLAEEAVWPMASVEGRDWGEGMFKNVACEYCDDVLAECADVAIGDAWLPEYVTDPRGTNVVVTRDSVIDSIIQEGAERGSLALDPADVSAVVQSQASGLRHRREGLSHRLARRQEMGEWTPTKRVAPKLAPSKARQEIYDARMEIAETSAMIFGQVRREQLPLDQFHERVASVLSRYRRAQLKEKRTDFGRFAGRAINRIRRLFQR